MTVLVLVSVAYFFQTAVFAFRFSGIAYRPSVKYQTVTEIVGFFGRQQGAQYLFDFCGIFDIMKAESARNSYAVCVNHNGRLTVNIAYHKISSFSADSGQFNKLFNGVGNNTVN